MRNFFIHAKFIILITLIFCILLSTVACNNTNEKIIVQWMDTDGSLIASQTVDADYDPTLRSLPEDNNLWHYTGWNTSQSGNIIVCTATRISKIHIVWKDSTGTVLHEIFIPEDKEIPTYTLPLDDEKWCYESWDKQTDENQIIFQAKRTPNKNFFIGNAFQIIVKDARGASVSSGSGFIINDQGWFITNNHVMENAASAVAFFDIKDEASGQQYVQLEVMGGVYNDKAKDIFIGKLNGYNKIKSYYNPIIFTEEYIVGEKSYSVGYPNSSIKMEINSGTILEEYFDIYNKIDGIYYVLSDSYIAPGSSGGILINEKLEVIGITSMGLYSDSSKNYYISGGSIPYALFKENLKNLSESNIKSLSHMYSN